MHLFSKKKVDPKEAAREAKRATKRETRGAQRDIDREMRDLDRSETQLLAEIKQRAKAPGMSHSDNTLKILAKQLVGVRQQKEKMLGAKVQLGAMAMKTNIMATQIGAAAAVGNVTGAMASMNNAIDTKEMAKIMNEFQIQTEKMSMKEELMDDALIDAFDSEGVDEEADEITGQVLAELGLELDGTFVNVNAPSAKLNVQEAEAEKEDDAFDALPDLKARLNSL
mmetsp:Transcript_24170/g.27859  ORF Transcript_24170/g.27859 Transcript_24170/m.27859 type:complete len:225 (-) Transcript_24170:132-806(-)|eukprot:CAMPEP_0194407620 /NCGR_PEP_ID=MMETSP0176-20130528/5622_1 /TAXON_ID=216777 /ORGANISM="Proboscia alata, Strain PI-D3" /LENGTH=224 /DNA_ID=CAMNT_0039207337 /DNA_START=40 /DNA_END=714 /DNA_ORIENTATION=+